jgi:hypothetical protein
MKFKDYVNKLNDILKDNPICGELEVITPSDAEFNDIYFPDGDYSLGHLNDDNEFINEEDIYDFNHDLEEGDEDLIEVNAIVIG